MIFGVLIICVIFGLDTWNLDLSSLRRIIPLVVAAIQVSTFADMEGEETFDSSFLGYADEVVEERIADDDVIMIKGTKSSSAV